MLNLGRNGTYGHFETDNQLGESGSAYHAQFSDAEDVDWTDKRLARITRLRLLSDVGFPYWDVSYCHGVLKDGSKVVVTLPFSQIPKRGFKGFIIKEAMRDGVYAKGLGLLNPSSYSALS